MIELSGYLRNVSKDMISRKFQLTFEVDEPPIEAGSIKDKKLSIRIAQYREKRSKDANALLWACIGEISQALRTDKWTIYLQMLKRYGAFTYICVKPEVVESVKAQWRECEEIGAVEINGKPAVQLLCYFGSSTYNTKEFSVLLDGVISEMREIGLQTPTSEDMQRSLELWEKQNQK